MENKVLDAIIKIIEEQELIIGPLAMELALKTPGIVSTSTGISVTNNNKSTVINLVNAYKDLFGDIAVQVSRDTLIKNHIDLKID